MLHGNVLGSPTARDAQRFLSWPGFAPVPPALAGLRGSLSVGLRGSAALAGAAEVSDPGAGQLGQNEGIMDVDSEQVPAQPAPWQRLGCPTSRFGPSRPCWPAGQSVCRALLPPPAQPRCQTRAPAGKGRTSGPDPGAGREGQNEWSMNGNGAVQNAA